MFKSFKKGVVIGFYTTLASRFAIFVLFIFGIHHLINMFLRDFKLIDLFGFLLCVYNTYWLTIVYDIKKKFHKYVMDILSNDNNSKSTKKFVADLIFTNYWREVYILHREGDGIVDDYIYKLSLEGIDKFNSGEL
jgi:hypothetical protein